MESGRCCRSIKCLKLWSRPSLVMLYYSTLAHTHIHTHTHMHTHILAHMLTCTRTHTHIHAHIYLQTHTHTHNTHTCMHARSAMTWRIHLTKRLEVWAVMMVNCECCLFTDSCFLLCKLYRIPRIGGYLVLGEGLRMAAAGWCRPDSHIGLLRYGCSEVPLLRGKWILASQFV